MAEPGTTVGRMNDAPTGDWHWSLGVLIGLPIAGVFALAGLAGIWAGVVARRRDRKRDYPKGWLDSGAGLGIGGGAAILAVTLIITGLAMWPWTAEYHQWRPVSGTVTAVDSRLLSAGDRGGTDQKFAVRLAGSTQEYGCADTRCSLVKPGQHLELECKRVWQYAGTPGYDCAYVRSDGGK